MVESSDKDQVKKKITDVKTFPVPFAFEAIKENIASYSNNTNKPTKEQIINEAFKLHSEGNTQEAAKIYQYLIDQGFSDHRVFTNYGNILSAFDKLKEAELLIRKAIELNPDYAIAHYNLGNILLDLGKLEEAELSTRKVIEINPDFTEAHSNLGIILNNLGKSQEAELSLRKAIELKPNYAEAHSNLGSILRNLGRLKEAELSLRKVIELNPNYSEANFNLGTILRDLGNLQEAETYIQKAIKLKPDYAEAHSNLGNILLGLGKLKEAELSLRKAIEINPDYAIAHYNLGIILKNLGVLQGAEKSYRKAIELNPNFEDAYFNLGSILKDLGQLKEAELSLRKAIEINPKFAMGHYLLSLIYSEEKLYSKAYKEINLAFKYDSKNHLIQGELTRIKFIIGTYDEKESEINGLWSDKDDYFYEDNNSDILLISFGSMGRNRKFIPSFNFYNLLKKDKSFDKLFLRDIDRNYYLTGLKNSTSNLEETIELIKNLSSVKRYKKTVSVGASAGGFAAILFGNLLKFSKVIAFNPQTAISGEKETIIKDTFYTVDLCKRLRDLNPSNALYQKCLSLKKLIPFKTNVEIHFSNLSEIDKNHAKFIEHKNCKLIKHNSSSHLLALQLRESKNLKEIIKESL
ncbi:tetratricopeptide repeat protein [Prochlorococcus marinus]|uniref:tetratricopeptide repeat protein n=1 Tax=Prochlorococcus marinus TaxID=1219 RepID=UPI0022B571AD|nr:tetratricopeptide repeat protein [Prochlorococcus marinus]